MTVRLLASIAACFAVLTVPSHPQAPAAAADPYRDEPFVFERYDTATTMKADGTGDVVQHVIVRVQSEGVAREFSVLNLSYASAYSTGTIDFVRVYKADGSTVTTPVDDAMEMPAEATREAPMYSDLKEKHLPVRGVAAGDRLEYQFHTTMTKAQAPGQFWGADHFITQGGVVLEQSVTLAVPETTYVQVWSPNHAATPVTKDGMKVWTWTSSQTKASARDENGKMTAAEVKDPDEDADGRKLPSVAWTTFHSWAEVGDWYRSLAEQRLQPTAAVRAKADELTKNAKTPQEQAEALYRFVATQIRYISLSFGVGRFQPHTPDEVLDHGYGDCKDKDTLLESLLRAKGMDTAPVLIGAGIAPVADVPSPSVFNHAITTVALPGADGKVQRVWLDSTAEVAPFRVLMPVIRDQQALVIPDKAPAALEKTPANPPYAYHEEFVAEGTLDKDGLLKSHMVWTTRSDNELEMRALMQRVSPAQWDDAMQYVSRNLGFGGKVSKADLRQDDPAAPVKVSYDYSRADFADWKGGRIIPLFPLLAVATVSKEKAPEHDIELGAPRTLEAHTTITLPEGYRPELPDAVHVKRDYTTFDKTYRFADGKLIVDRTVVVKTKKLSKDQWKDYLAFTKAADFENESFIPLIAPSVRSERKPSSGKDKSAIAPVIAPVATDASAAELMDEAASAYQHQDWDAVRLKVSAAKSKSPDARRVHSWTGFLDTHDRKWDDAITEYRQELKLYPDSDQFPILQLATLLSFRKHTSDAIDLLKGYSSRDDVEITTELMNLQARDGKKEDALATVQTYLARHPDDEEWRASEASLLHVVHRDDEAIAVAKTLLAKTKDPNLLNNNAYLLAELKSDLPFAEEKSRESIQRFAELTAEIDVDSANQRSFSLSSNMVAAFDTLGYILTIENKQKEAEPYMLAAWNDYPDVVKGDHLAAVYEALGRKPEAMWIDHLAMSTDNAKFAKVEWDSIKEREKRLGKESIRSASGAGYPETLQEMRTFKLKRLDGLEGGGTVRVLIDAQGISGASLVSGPPTLKPLLTDVKHVKLSGSVPTGSSARVLRDAVVFCGATSSTCDFVFMIQSGIGSEGASQ